ARGENACRLRRGEVARRGRGRSQPPGAGIAPGTGFRLLDPFPVPYLRRGPLSAAVRPPSRSRAMTQHYEKLGACYLVRDIDPESGSVTDEVVLYNSRDLSTHAVIIGMSGSGKTGLGISLLEEAAMDRIPVIAIDPKSDLTNLLLTFPDLSPADFRP